MTDSGIDFVLFDLGGVLIELGGVSSLQEMATVVGNEEVSEWALDLPPERFLEIFRDWPIGPYPGTAEVLAEVKRSVPIGCLSNTNTMHWEHQTALWPILDMFDFRFLSFELGLAKPDEAIFHAVADRLPFGRDRILYFDDVDVNSEAARSFGFQSKQVRGIDEVKRELREAGVLPG